MEQKEQKKVKKSKRRLGGKIAAAVALPILCLLAGLTAAVAMVCKGPSPTARNLFVTTVMETSALKFIPRLFLSQNVVDDIMRSNTVVDTGEVTDQDLIEVDNTAPQEEQQEIEIHDVTGPTFHGKMMIVRDPSRVKVSTCPVFGPQAPGMRVEDMMKARSAVAGINGGGFQDDNGMGSGGQPLGLVFRDGQLLNGSPDTRSCLVGFDKDDKLVVGTMTGREAINRNIRDAVSFGPVFIVNGKRAEISGTGGGLNPRTVIGQRRDGAVLLLTIDGRQAASLGANYEDCINVMEEFGAVNAANLDGGSSSVMFYEGKLINNCSSLYGSRKIPTAFIVI